MNFVQIVIFSLDIHHLEENINMRFFARPWGKWKYDWATNWEFVEIPHKPERKLSIKKEIVPWRLFHSLCKSILAEVNSKKPKPYSFRLRNIILWARIADQNKPNRIPRWQSLPIEFLTNKSFKKLKNAYLYSLTYPVCCPELALILHLKTFATRESGYPLLKTRARN